MRLWRIKGESGISLEHTSGVVVFVGEGCEVNRLTWANDLSLGSASVLL